MPRKRDDDPLRAILRAEQANAERLIRYAARRSALGESDWIALSREIGRNWLPSLLTTVWHALPNAERIRALANTWTLAEFPERQLGRADWLAMFRAVGYIDEDAPATAPDEVTLWRGGIRRTGMAWTADREHAEWFRRRFGDGKPARLWTVTVGPDRLLAHFDALHRHEHEYVIDPTGLRSTEPQ